jgi:tRNA G18 (ribose-2'-O)-methylase SpoU
MQRDTKGEIKVYGRNACAALWQHRAADIVRVYVTEPMLKDFGPLLKWCAKNKKAYHVLDNASMEKVAQSVHHEGVVILGGETGGASPQLLRAADHVLQIPGTGVVESLNVSVAAGLVLGEYWRRHQAPAAPAPRRRS